MRVGIRVLLLGNKQPDMQPIIVYLCVGELYATFGE